MARAVRRRRPRAAAVGMRRTRRSRASPSPSPPPRSWSIRRMWRQLSSGRREATRTSRARSGSRRSSATRARSTWCLPALPRSVRAHPPRLGLSRLRQSVGAPWQCAAFYANRAACYAKLGEHSSVVDDCTAALDVQPEYTKALLRRALAREALDQPTEAYEDAKRAVALEPSDREAAAMLPRLERKSEAKVEQQKEEMIGKLKDLGNSVLGARRLRPANLQWDDPHAQRGECGRALRPFDG